MDDNPIGYDGREYGIGDRVELHPGADLWMRGARFGVVVGIVPTPDDRVRVQLDKGQKVCGSADTFKLAD
jgi:hypothetical protein